MKIVEERRITMSALRSLCIRENWYTLGTDEEYDHILLFADRNEMTTENLAKVAADIMAHSEMDCDRDIPNTMFSICECCHTFFYEE